MPQELSIYENLGAAANLELFGALYGLSGALLRERVAAALALVGLADRAKDKPSTFSGGMKRRLNIAAALVHDPDILIFDEPTVGVDPQSRNAIFDNLEDAAPSAARRCSTPPTTWKRPSACATAIVIIDHGKVVASDTLAGLERLLPAVETLEIEVDGAVDLAALARRCPASTAVTQDGDAACAPASPTSGAHAPALLAALAAQRAHGVQPHRVGAAPASKTSSCR